MWHITNKITIKVVQAIALAGNLAWFWLEIALQKKSNIALNFIGVSLLKIG